MTANYVKTVDSEGCYCVRITMDHDFTLESTVLRACWPLLRQFLMIFPLRFGAVFPAQVVHRSTMPTRIARAMPEGWLIIFVFGTSLLTPSRYAPRRLLQKEDMWCLNGLLVADIGDILRLYHYFLMIVLDGILDVLELARSELYRQMDGLRLE